MNIIKLDAIGSTNTYLKDLLTVSNLENFIVVVAENQFAGKGQRGSTWTSEAGSSLSFSVLMKDILSSPEYVFDLNVMVALSVYQALKKTYNLPFYIKWPNDILSYNKKICGILIENIIKANGETQSIVGIGINVNQESFNDFPQASSLFKLTGTKTDKDVLLNAVLDELKYYSEQYLAKGGDFLWIEYHSHLYRINTPTAFENKEHTRFMGIIKEVTKYGLIRIQLEDDSIQEFGMKEIKMLY